MRRMTRGPADRGAAAIIVAIVLPVILLVLGGIVIDVGSWYSVRAQSQNGADAGAIAVARACALDTTGAACTEVNATTIADNYSEANSNHNFDTGGASHRVVCGNGGTLTSCSSPSVPSNPCPSAPPNGNYVNVQTISNQAVGLGGSLLGNKTQIAACAQANWGNAVIGGNIVALTIAECAWNTDTAGGTNYAPSPPALPLTSAEQALVIHNPDDANDPACTSGPSVGPLPGGFGWTVPDPSSGNCMTAFIPNSGGWYSNDPGQGTSTTSQCLDGGQNPGVIPCAQNPVVTSPPYPPNQLNGCPTPATPSPLIVPIYDNVCVQTGTGAVSQDEMQQVIVSSNANGGTYTLTFTNASSVSATTTTIPYDANAATLQSKLEALPNVGVGNVLVAGTPSNFTVEFTGALRYTNFPRMSSDPSSLTSSTNPRATVTVNAIQDGAYVGNACPAGFANGKYYHLASLAAFVITGYEGSAFPHPRASWLTGRNWCVSPTGQDKPCLLGYFVKATTTGEIGSGPPTGVTVVKLSG